MGTGIIDKATVLIACTVIVFATSACFGTPESVPDIESTVQARLLGQRTAEATVEARARIIAETMVRATVQALHPTPTVTPPGVISASVSVNRYNPLIVEFDLILGAPAKVFVEYGNRRAGYFRSKMTEDVAVAHRLSLVRIRASTTYSYKIFVVDGQGEASVAWKGVFRSGPLPDGLHHFATIVQGQPTYPLTLKEHNDDDFHGLVVLDSGANIVWYYESVNGPVTAVAQESDGNLVYIANQVGLREIDPLGEEVSRLDETCMVSEGQGQIHHEVLIRPDNRVLYLSSAIHEVVRGQELSTITSDIVAEWDQYQGTNRILFDIFDFVPREVRTKSPKVSEGFFWKGCRGVSDDVKDLTHSNSIFVGERGNVILSIRHLDQIISISPDLRSVEWRLGGYQSDFTFFDSNDRFYHQHSAVQLANGNILLFDNGNTRPEDEGGEYSRGLELRLDFDDMVASKVWEYRHDPDLFAGCCSNVTRLGNGNTVLVFGSDLSRAECCRVFTLVESDPSGQRVFEVQMKSPGMPIQYRVHPISSINGETSIAGQEE